MKNLKTTILMSAASILEASTKKEILGWPPNCMGLLFEPERPDDCNDFHNVEVEKTME